MRLPSTRTKLLVVAALYFASGFPFGLINYLLPVFLRSEGAELSAIGRLVSDAGLAWTLKFLWSPLVDRVGTRKQWIVPCQMALAAVTVALVTIDPRGHTAFLWLLLACIAFLSATQDIAIDAYTIELLDVRELGYANGVRVSSYRIALIATSGLLVALAGRMGWDGVFLIGAALMLLLAAFSASLPALGARPLSERPTLLEPVRALLRLPSFWAVVLFVLTFKLGDVALTPMTAPFWVDRGLSSQQIGFIGTLSLGAAIGGALLGGALTSRWGMFRALWILGLAQALSNLAYYAAATISGSATAIYAAAVVEQFTGGLGTAAFLAFLMSLCDKRYAATQYAVVSALYGLSRWLGGRYSGDLVESMGYASYFLLTFFMALPAYGLLPWMRARESAVINRESGVGSRESGTAV
ncbi:MAG: MFS transporter [Gemmatimonadaceae bacterium]